RGEVRPGWCPDRSHHLGANPVRWLVVRCEPRLIAAACIVVLFEPLLDADARSLVDKGSIPRNLPGVAAAVMLGTAVLHLQHEVTEQPTPPSQVLERVVPPVHHSGRQDVLPVR